jgi:hypothetical protein
MQAQHVEELKAQIGTSGARVVLDLEELSLVDMWTSTRCVSSALVKPEGSASCIVRLT